MRGGTAALAEGTKFFTAVIEITVPEFNLTRVDPKYSGGAGYAPY